MKVGKNCHISEEADIAENVIIGDNVKIYPNVKIGENTKIGDNCIIGHPTKVKVQGYDFSAKSPLVKDFLVEPGTRIGGNSLIRSGTIIYDHVNAGEGLKTGHYAIIREHTTLGENCIVGTNAILDGYIKIGEKSMIQSHCYLAQTVKIGDYTFIAPGCIFFDNRTIVLGYGLRAARVGSYVRIGGGSKILPKITIEDYALIGAGSVVTRDIPSRAVAYGSPARIARFQSQAEINEYIKSMRGWI